MGASVRPEFSPDNPFVKHDPGGDIDLGASSGEEFSPDNPFAKKHGVVTVGKVEPIGVPVEEYARLASSGTLKDRIQANLMIASNPELARAVQPIAKRMQAPGAASTAINIAESNLISPFSDRAAESATQAALDRYTEGGHDPSEHANLFGAAAALGAVGGNAALVGTGKAAAQAGRLAVADEALPLTRVGRILHAAKSGAVTNAAVSGGGAALFGDEEGKRDLPAIARATGEGAVVGGAFGAGLGALGEGAAALAKRNFSSTQLNLPEDAASEIKTLASRIPDEHLAADGRDATPHITVKYGLHDEDPERVKQLLADEPPISVSLGKTSYFPNGESGNGDVLKVDVDSPELHRLNGKIAAALPNTETHPEYKPHATIAYLKPGLGEQYAGDESLSGRKLTLNRLTFSSKNGKTVEIPLTGKPKESAVPRVISDGFVTTPDGRTGINGVWIPGKGQPHLDEPGTVEYRHAGIGLVPRVRDMIRTGYRGALVTPYASIEGEAPELVDALHTAGAARGAAQHVGDRRAAWVTEGLTKEQKGLFGKQLVLDNLTAEAARKADSDPAAAANFARHALTLARDVPADTPNQPWFAAALARHRQFVEPTMNDASIGAGVDPASFRQPSSAYLKLFSEDRLSNKEIRRAMDAAQVAEPGELDPRSPLMRKLLGENPELRRLFPDGATGLRHGPLNPNVPSLNVDKPIYRQGASQTGSAQSAKGSAREYVTDYERILRQDAQDKVVRSAKNAVYEEVAKVGRPLAEKEEPALGKKVIERSVLDDEGKPSVQRWEVSPKVAAAVQKFERQSAVNDNTGIWRKFSSAATRLQISGMPVEATSHMNSLASIVASVPGEKDAFAKATAAVPGVGAKLAAIREMAETDFNDPKIRELESRLADIGALRIDEDRGGLINSAHHALFGPEGVDVRGRLALARKYLDRKPEATDRELREFIVGKLGNYVRANSGDAVNALQDAGVSAFARFQAARIPSSVRSAILADAGLPKQTVGDRLNTLYRGPLGYAIAAEAANRAMSGHSIVDNERGHQTDVQLPFTVGPHDRPVYLPLAFTNPVVATGLRATGLRDAIPFPGSPNTGGKFADAGRDVVNTALGVASPALRALSIAATGRTPYVNSDGSFLRVTDPKFDKASQSARNFKAAFSLGNPAMSAFAEHGGDVGGNTLSDALAEDGRTFGGPSAIAARVSEFLAPRVATVGVGGTDAETSALHRDEREYNDALNGYKSRLRRAAGPKEQDRIIEEAVRDAESDGRFNPDLVQDQLRKYADTPPEKRDQAAERRDRGFERKVLQ